MAESQFYAILTDQGAALEATALATGTPVALDKFVIGDGGGNAVTPDPTRTTLVNEVYRGSIQKAESQDNQVTFTLYVPPEAGGYTIREAGILTADGTLYSLSNSPDILKPTESNGAVISITFRYTLAVSSTSTVNVIVYEDYLTPEAADSKYLQIGKNLSEIALNGDEAKAAARKNIGIDGDIAYRDKQNTFTEPNTFDNYLISNQALRICGANDKKLICDIYGYYTDSRYEVTFSRTRVANGTSVGGAYYFEVNSPDELILEDATLKKQYVTWNSGNLTPVKTVNNVGPDASGNVKVSTGSTVDLSNYYTKSEVDALINSGDYASATPGAVRSYGTFSLASNNNLTPTEGAQLNGSSIKFAGLSRPDNGDLDFCAFGSSPAGIWRVISWGGGEALYGTLFFAVRIS